MYIFELLVNIFNKKRNLKEDIPSYEYNEAGLEENSDDCEHLFLPLDSSQEYFACKYCGLVVPKDKLKNKNIFENKSF